MRQSWGNAGTLVAATTLERNVMLVTTHAPRNCLPLSHTRLSVSNDPNIFQAVDMISIAEFCGDLFAHKWAPCQHLSSTTEIFRCLIRTLVSITHMFLCHVHWKSVHHYFSANLSHVGRAATRATSSASIAARTSITLSIAVFVRFPTPMRRLARSLTAIIIAIIVSVVLSRFSISGELRSAVLGSAVRS